MLVQYIPTKPGMNLGPVQVLDPSKTRWKNAAFQGRKKHMGEVTPALFLNLHSLQVS